MKLATTLTQTNTAHPPLVLIHGLGSAATAFKPIIAELTQSFRVITVDLPGHGQSAYTKGQALAPQALGSAIFEAVRGEYGVEKFHVVGNSLGGWIALEMAAALPDRIMSLTGLAPAGLWLKPAAKRELREARSFYLVRLLKPVIRGGLNSKLLRWIGFATVSPKWQELSYETTYDAAYALLNCPGYFPAWDGMLTRRFDRAVPIRVPITIVFGDSDNTLPYPISQERSLAPAHSKWLVIDNCGHAPMWDHPDLIVKIINQTANR
ncbi:MAG: alpha/beta hydrolase [Candidatus Planktophila sp.]|nr:alpha/beta hydrolase [Candidatus Planktophila sp.]